MPSTTPEPNGGDFLFRLAMPADDADIRRLLAANPVPGRVTVAYEREPDYFLGCGTMGEFCQTIVARHRPTGELAALACRASRPLFVNGRREEVGYLGQLRVAAPFRGRWVVSGGFRFLADLHRDGRVDGYLTTIVDGNREAEGILVRRPRPHYPVYREVDRLHTLALVCRRSSPASGDRPCTIEKGTDVDLSAIVDFLQREGSTRQFFPCWSETDFRPGAAATLGFRLDDLAVAVRAGRIVGTMGLWDQSSFKQAVVKGYRGALRWGRPLYNLAARLQGRRPLPPAGEALRLAYACCTCIGGHDPAVFASLLEHLCRHAYRRGYAFLMLGLAGRDPLLATAGSYPHILYPSRLYTVGWGKEPVLHDRLDPRVAHVELASL